MENTREHDRERPKCEVRYGPRLAQHRQKFAEDRLPISCRCQHLFSAQQRFNTVPNSGFLTSRMVCRGKSDTWPSNVPSMGRTLALLLSELDVIVKVTFGLVYTARNSIASSTIFESKPEFSGNVTNELRRKMVKIKNPIAKLCHYLGIFSGFSHKFS